MVDTGLWRNGVHIDTAGFVPEQGGLLFEAVDGIEWYGQGT